MNPGSQACVGNPGDLVVTSHVALLVLVLGIAGILLVYQLLRLIGARRPWRRSAGVPPGTIRARGAGRRRTLVPMSLVWIAVTALVAGIGFAVADRVAGQGVLFEVRGFQSTYLALLLAIPLGLVAAFVLTARDARRFTAGTIFAIVVAFLVLYPNISALPLPSIVVNAYQGLLPTYLYPFQFPVNTDPAAPGSEALLARTRDAVHRALGHLSRGRLRGLGVADRPDGPLVTGRRHVARRRRGVGEAEARVAAQQRAATNPASADGRELLGGAAEVRGDGGISAVKCSGSAPAAASRRITKP